MREDNVAPPDASGAQECVILIGLPAAGKTRFYRDRFAATHAQVSRDVSRRAGRDDPATPRAVDEHLGAGRSVVVDNTNLRRADRAPLIETARRHGARVVGYFFDVTTRQAVARNAERTGSERVPNVAIFTAAKRLERPDACEGFDALFRVTAPRAGGFDVTRVV